VAAWKERGVRTLAGEAARIVAGVVPPPPVVALAYVPGDPDRSLWRGQNTAQALARELAVLWGLPVADALERTRTVRPQRGLPRQDRRQNVRGSFHAFSKLRTVALVDDVYTTGATVSAAATELRRAGARHVHVVTFARAVRR
jgi:predicted amidophosphoribosyltransferase